MSQNLRYEDAESVPLVLTTDKGVEEAIRLRRHWTPSERTCRERFEVLRNGEPDHRAADQWTELVEGYMPSRIAPLFLFDGEKIERYADLMSAGELIETAVQNLLGLDVVDTLVSSLGQLERRKRLSLKVPNEALEAETLRARIRELERERSALVQERASVANQVDRAEKAFALANDRYTREGGPLFQRRDHTLSALGQAEEALEQIRREQRELAGGVAPFLLLPDLLQAVTQRDELEDSARSSREILDALKQEFSVLEEASFQWDIGDQMKLRSHMAARLRERANAAAFDIKLDLTRDARSSLRSLLDRELPHAHGSICVLARNEKLVIGRIEELRAEIDAIPTPEAAEDLIFRLDQAKAELDRLSLEQDRRSQLIDQLERELLRLQEKEQRLLRVTAEYRLEHEDTERAIRYVAKSRGTLAIFRKAVIESHVERIEQFILESFQQLVMKPGLVEGFKISPSDFSIELHGSTGSFTPERLSAGERQLLAIAVLWGLARASGRPLPAVIDTPLGRLDSAHRSHLVQRYLPFASHQVILLSTDEEIAGPYLDQVRPFLARNYRLRFNGTENSTVIEQVYAGEDLYVH